MEGIRYISKTFYVFQASVDEYFTLAMEYEPDLIINPCEQVTSTSGKKKRKRSIKAAIKNLEKFSRLISN